MKIIAFAIAAALLSTTAVSAQEWIGVDGGETSILGYDRGSVRTTATGRAVWVATVFKTTQQDDAEHGDYDFIVSRHTVDCDNERTKTLSMRSFSFDEERPHRLINDEGDWEYHQPESLFGMLLSDVCGITTLERSPFPTARDFALDARELLNR